MTGTSPGRDDDGGEDGPGDLGSLVGINSTLFRASLAETGRGMAVAVGVGGQEVHPHWGSLRSAGGWGGEVALNRASE